MPVRLPAILIRSLETVRRTKIFVPGQGELRGHLIAEALEDVARPAQFIGRNIAASLDGGPNVPKTPSGIVAQHIGGGVVDIAIQDQPEHPAVNYFVEVANNPGFAGARVIHSGPSRNTLAILPSGKWYVRAYSQYQYSGSGSNSGDPPPATSVLVSGSIATGTLLGSQGSGTGSGRTPGSGFGTLEPVLQVPGAVPFQPPINTLGSGSSSSSTDAIQSFTNSNLGASVAVSATTVTTVMSVSVTMPATGGPFRAIVRYQFFMNGGTGAGWQTWIDDGTNQFAVTQRFVSNNDSCCDASEVSPTIYANGQAVTFTAKIFGPGAGTVVTTPSGEGTPGNVTNVGVSHMSVSILGAAN